MIMIFKELIAIYNVNVNYNIGELPEADKNMKARYLQDGVTVRKYVKNGAWDNTIIILIGLSEKRIKHFSWTCISELREKYYEKFYSI